MKAYKQKESQEEDMNFLRLTVQKVSNYIKNNQNVTGFIFLMRELNQTFVSDGEEYDVLYSHIIETDGGPALSKEEAILFLIGLANDLLDNNPDVVEDIMTSTVLQQIRGYILHYANNIRKRNNIEVIDTHHPYSKFKPEDYPLIYEKLDHMISKIQDIIYQNPEWFRSNRYNDFSNEVLNFINMGIFPTNSEPFKYHLFPMDFFLDYIIKPLSSYHLIMNLQFRRLNNSRFEEWKNSYDGKKYIENILQEIRDTLMQIPSDDDYYRLRHNNDSILPFYNFYMNFTEYSIVDLVPQEKIVPVLTACLRIGEFRDEILRRVYEKEENKFLSFDYLNIEQVEQIVELRPLIMNVFSYWDIESEDKKNQDALRQIFKKGIKNILQPTHRENIRSDIIKNIKNEDGSPMFIDVIIESIEDFEKNPSKGESTFDRVMSITGMIMSTGGYEFFKEYAKEYGLMKKYPWTYLTIHNQIKSIFNQSMKSLPFEAHISAFDSIADRNDMFEDFIKKGDATYVHSMLIRVVESTFNTYRDRYGSLILHVAKKSELLALIMIQMGNRWVTNNKDDDNFFKSLPFDLLKKSAYNNVYYKYIVDSSSYTYINPETIIRTFIDNIVNNDYALNGATDKELKDFFLQVIYRFFLKGERGEDIEELLSTNADTDGSDPDTDVINTVTLIDQIADIAKKIGTDLGLEEEIKKIILNKSLFLTTENVRLLDRFDLPFLMRNVHKFKKDVNHFYIRPRKAAEEYNDLFDGMFVHATSSLKNLYKKMKGGKTVEVCASSLDSHVVFSGRRIVICGQGKFELLYDFDAYSESKLDGKRVATASPITKPLKSRVQEPTSKFERVTNNHFHDYFYYDEGFVDMTKANILFVAMENIRGRKMKEEHKFAKKFLRIPILSMVKFEELLKSGKLLEFMFQVKDRQTHDKHMLDNVDDDDLFV